MPLQNDFQRSIADFTARREREQRRYHGRRPKTLADVVAQLINKRGYGRIQSSDELAAAWQTAAGTTLAATSRVGKLSRGQLEIWVKSSISMQEFTFEKERILAELSRILPNIKIRTLRFRLGAIN